MKDKIKNIRNSLDNTLAAVQDGLYSLKTLYFFKGQSGLREYIKDKVSLATACLWNRDKSKKDKLYAMAGVHFKEIGIYGV